MSKKQRVQTATNTASHPPGGEAVPMKLTRLLLTSLARDVIAISNS